MSSDKRFCPKCGTQVTFSIPKGDNRKRATCGNCEHIDYDNPLIITGTIPCYDNKVLLCRRNIEPRLGCWTLPAGFMENNESTSEGAIRETLEESGSLVICKQLYSIISIPQISQVHMFYLADLPDLGFHPTEESSEVKLFSIDEIPWNELSFESVTTALKHFVKDSEANLYSFYEDTLYIEHLSS